MRTFIAVLFASFFGVLGALYADRWLMASGLLPLPPVARSVSVAAPREVFSYRGSSYSIVGGELARQLSPRDTTVLMDQVKRDQSTSSRVVRPEGEVSWSNTRP